MKKKINLFVDRNFNNDSNQYEYFVAYINKNGQKMISTDGFTTYDEAYDYCMNYEEQILNDINSKENARNSKNLREKKHLKHIAKKNWMSIVAITLSVISLVISYAKGKVSNNNVSSKKIVDEDFESNNDGVLAYNMDDNSVIINENVVENNPLSAALVNSSTIDNSIENIASKDDEFNTDSFENVTANFANYYVQNGVDSVSTEEITKFVSIANIDKLAEENPELLQTLFSVQTKEEYLNDAAKVIGATVMYNYQIWDQTHSTDNFINVSESIIGSPKDDAEKIEDYTVKIANAVNSEDATLVNELISEFIVELNSGSLSKMDDGVGFVTQVNIAMVADVIAKDYLDEQNFNNLQILKSSEKFVSNIYTVYENCGNTNNSSVGITSNVNTNRSSLVKRMVR